MLIGLAQMHIAWEDKEVNKEQVTKVVARFAEICKENTSKDLPLLLFPEMTLTGFSMQTNLTADVEREAVAMVIALAKKYTLAIGIGWVKQHEDESDLCENHYSIVTPEGELLDYAKVHPFTYSEEDKHFQGGNHLSVCEVGSYKVGATICYDLRFAEMYRRLSDVAELIVVPANWPQVRSHHWKSLLMARAIENQCYVAGINCVGEMGDLFYSGDSGLYNPDGELCKPIVADTFDNGSNLYVYDVENNVAEVRNAFPVQQDKNLEKILHMQLKNSVN